MAKLPFTFGTGIINSSSVKFAVYSFSNSPVTLTVDGRSPQVLNMIGFGTDGIGGATDSSDVYPVALYVATVDILGLKQERINLSVTQDGITRKGKTNPDLGDVDSKIIFITCDSFGSLTLGVGAWKSIRREIEEGNVQTIIHTDDHGYTGRLGTNDTGTNGTGRYAGEPRVDWTEYSRYLAYACYLGLMETDQDNVGYVPDFNEEDRIYCRENCPKWASVGDWELKNNPAEDDTLTAAQILTAKNAFLNTVGATNTYLNINNSAAWVQRVGSLEVIALDRCFSLTPLTLYYDTATETNNISANKLLGDAQIVDIKNALDTSSPFKVVALPLSCKHISDASFRLSEKSSGWYNSSWFGAQQPLHDYTADTSGDTISYVSEFRSLMTSLNDSVCAKAQAYNAPVVGWHGDTHRPYEYYLYFPQDENNVELNILECSSGAVCPAFSHRLHPLIKEKYYYRGTIVNWLADWTGRNPYTIPEARATYLSIELKKQGNMIINYIEADGILNGTKKHSTQVKRHTNFGLGKNYRFSSI